MPVVNMLMQMSGPRQDGQSWPAVGDPIDVADWEATQLCEAGIAWLADTPEPSEPLPDDVPAEPVPVDVPADRPPPTYAPKADWVDHAVAQGHDPADAETLTKAALIETYGT